MIGEWIGRVGRKRIGFGKVCAGLGVASGRGGFAGWSRFVVLFNPHPGSGEGRENRPQLRCGIASNQTHILQTKAGAKPFGVTADEGEGRGRVCVARNSRAQVSKSRKEPATQVVSLFGVWMLGVPGFCARGTPDMRSPNIPSGCAHACGAELLRAPKRSTSSQK